MKTQDMCSRIAGADEGFSLTELLVVTTLMVSILSVAWLAFNSVSGFSDRIVAREKASTAATAATDRIAQELFRAGGPVFKSVASDKVVFYVMANATTAKTKSLRVTYYVSGGKLYRTEAVANKGIVDIKDSDFGADGAPIVVLSPVKSTSVFQYYNGGSYDATSGAYVAPAAVTEAPSVSAVKITVSTNATSGMAAVDASSSTFVNIRTRNIINDDYH